MLRLRFALSSTEWRSLRSGIRYERSVDPSGNDLVDFVQFLVGVFASLGSLLFGYDLGVIAQVIASPSFHKEFNNPADNETGAVVSVFTGGAFIGAGVAGFLADRIGRRLTIMIGAIIFCLGGALQTGAQALSYLYSGRAIAGLG